MPEKSVTRLYARWETEKARLVSAIRNRPGCEEEVIDEWFCTTVFNYETQNAMSRYELETLRHRDQVVDYELHELKRLGMSMGVGIATTEGFVTDVKEWHNDFRIRRLSVLVLGLPKMVRDNKTGVIRPVR